MNPPAELRGRKALVVIDVRQRWIMGQQCGLLMEARDIKLQDASPQVCPLKARATARGTEGRLLDSLIYEVFQQFCLFCKSQTSRSNTLLSSFHELV